MKKRRPLLHVGFHKTATTWLQRSVFAAPNSGFESHWPVREHAAIHAFVVPDDASFDPDVARTPFVDGIEHAARTGSVPVISHEDLCGFPVRGEYYGAQVAARLHASFPEARVLIGIREQRSMLFSMYQQYIRQYGTEPIETYLGDEGGNLDPHPVCRRDHLAYVGLIRSYQTLFGAENVLVLPIELLRSERSEYLRRLSAFVDSSAVTPLESGVLNPRWSGLTLAMRRRINRVLTAPPPRQRPGRMHLAANHLCYAFERLSRSSWHLRIEADWRRFVAARASGYYGRSNRELAALVGLDLSQLGYDTDEG